MRERSRPNEWTSWRRRRGLLEGLTSVGLVCLNLDLESLCYLVFADELEIIRDLVVSVDCRKRKEGKQR
jgi:hypothetical protein